MLTDENLIRQVIKLYEENTGWGDSAQWSNQDFLQLSELIRDKTGVTISHVTLKRIWGKVKYESLPNTHTLNTLVQFLGYENWRDFSVKRSNGEGAAPNGTLGVAPTGPGASWAQGPGPSGSPGSALGEMPGGGGVQGPNAGEEPEDREVAVRRREQWMRRAVWAVVPLALVFLILLFLHAQQPSPQAQDYVFNSKKTVTTGLPNSVIFNYDATRSPDDSVVIQQSWDTTRRVKVPKNAHQYTSIYYYPDFYHATLQVHGKVVKSHNLLIESNGWLPVVAQDPVPVYFTKADAMVDGKMQLTVDQIRQKNIPMQPKPPTVFFMNVRDFGEIYSDHFTFETSLRDDYSEGSSACEQTRVYLLCEGTAIWIPLSARGCISNSDLFFTYFYTSGTREDLSAFGVDFSNYVKLRIESDSGKARILINDKLVYTVPRHIMRSKIIGIDYQFQGTGSVDYVSLTNGKVSYRDNF